MQTNNVHFTVPHTIFIYRDTTAMRKGLITIGMCLLATYLTTPVVAGSVAKDKQVTITYHGIRPTDPHGMQGLRNPARGFRWENRFASPKAQWQPHHWLRKIQNGPGAIDGITMTQGYVELQKYYHTPILPSSVMHRLQRDFDALRRNGLKVILCFRYRMHKSQPGPTLDIIMGHIHQLAPVLKKNMDVIAALQAGFIGMYGEWHNSAHKLGRKAKQKVITALLHILPPQRRLELRYPKDKSNYIQYMSRRSAWEPITAQYAQSYPMRPASRIGIFDAGFLILDNDAGTFAPPPSKSFHYMAQESLFVPMEGELFWTSSPYQRDGTNGKKAILRMWKQHYTFFSYAHGNSYYEGWQWKKKYGAKYAIDQWRKKHVGPKFLKQNHLPFSKSYFEGADHELVKRSIFDYIRDHLGYRLELQQAQYTSTVEQGGDMAIDVTFVNHGFAAPINPRPVYFVLIGPKGTVTQLPKVRSHARRWYPCVPNDRTQLAPAYHWILHCSLPEGLAPGQYRIGVWLPDQSPYLQYDPSYAIRVANRDATWWVSPAKLYGINVLGKVQIKANSLK